ncbi:translation factor GUF1 homolog, mitochondrial isoform X2 [Leptopilina boulardi]|uniref:translation factor GUF1 homolog, mitochondrial isoform X2 n=1 Tax=Leptopilina boulardi TaxID=63433 RepID=UPI0021F64B4A|nr:translation factor GUF1 homolog, mitochondrial isoform X2 [Leptopilina boulardi]
MSLNIVFSNTINHNVKRIIFPLNTLQNLRNLRTERCLMLNRTCSSASAPNVAETPIENIRNFSIIAHVDHGKSTLADRLLEMTGAIKTNSGAQILDKLQVEKERGITVKAQTASLKYTYNGVEYLLNLIDTPGHVDFSSEVYRSLAACQGVILLVDANDGVQAQTVANFYLAFERDLTMIPIINKIDLKNANPDRVLKQLHSLFEIDSDKVLKISAKNGTNCEAVLEAIVERIPPPPVSRAEPFRALIFDSWYNKYKGAVSLIYVQQGRISVGENISSCHTGKVYEVKSLSFLRPEEEDINTLYAGQVGALKCNMKSLTEAHIGDTFRLKDSTVKPLPGFKVAKSMVFAGIYPIDQSQFPELRNALEKLTLNDNAVTVVEESSPALGRGWRLGFLGLLHMEVFVQRLEQEYGAEPILSSPGVTYKAKVFGTKSIQKYKGEEFYFSNPIDFPDPVNVTEFYEPIVRGTIITPAEYLGGIKTLCREKRGVEESIKYIDNERMILQYMFPLNEIIMDFHGGLKSVTSGYASFDYEDCGYQTSNIVKMIILLNGNPVEELSTIVHASSAVEKAKALCFKLLNLIPKQQFLISIQAKVGAKILARENLPALRKDVCAKLYGGDVTRRKKLLSKQAEGKKKLRMIGNISIPRETYIKILQR